MSCPSPIAISAACLSVLLPLASAVAQPAPVTPPAAPSPPTAPEAPEPSTVERLVAESALLTPLMTTDLARAFLKGAADLPVAEPRTIWRSREKGVAFRPEQYDRLAEPERAELTSRDCSADFFYYTGYGSPLVYARVLDIAAAHGLDSLAGKRVLDFGYGSIGQLRLMAMRGADAHGVDVEPILAALYGEPGDTGALGAGSVHVHHGRWPADAPLITEIGAHYDLITSKNTLKAGYIHPAREADPRMLVNLGVDDAAFLKQTHDALNTGGLFVIYNICPAQNPVGPGPNGEPPKPYIPYADGWSPFTREQFAEAGLEVLAFDERDEAHMHPIFAALEYDNGDPAALKSTIFVWYTVARRVD